MKALAKLQLPALSASGAGDDSKHVVVGHTWKEKRGRKKGEAVLKISQGRAWGDSAQLQRKKGRR